MFSTPRHWIQKCTQARNLINYQDEIQSQKSKKFETVKLLFEFSRVGQNEDIEVEKAFEEKRHISISDSLFQSPLRQNTPRRKNHNIDRWTTTKFFNHKFSTFFPEACQTDNVT